MYIFFYFKLYAHDLHFEISTIYIRLFVVLNFVIRVRAFLINHQDVYLKNEN